MSSYIRQSQGRIRIKSPGIKERRYESSLIRRVLLEQEGISMVRINTFTGSVVVRYDTEQILPARIINLFGSLGLLPNVVGFPGPWPGKTRAVAAPLSEVLKNEIVREVSVILIRTMVEKAISDRGGDLVRRVLGRRGR